MKKDKLDVAAVSDKQSEKRFDIRLSYVNLTMQLLCEGSNINFDC